MTVSERLITFIKSQGMSICEFERRIHAGNGYVSRIKNDIKEQRRKEISLNYPELNLDWVLSGNGNMLSMPGVEENKTEYKTIPRELADKNRDELIAIIEKLQQVNEHQRKIINEYSRMSENLKF